MALHYKYGGEVNGSPSSYCTHGAITGGYDRLCLGQTRNVRRIFVGKTLRRVLHGEPMDLRENAAHIKSFRLVISGGQRNCPC